MRLKRLQSELKELNTETSKYFRVKQVGDSMINWIAVIMGPENTPYEGGLFHLDIILPENYPFKPPTITFVTKIFHPNISYTGEICMDLLKESWSPVLTISSLILSLISMLNDPNLDDPLSLDVAELYKYNSKEYFRTAKEWTHHFAISMIESHSTAINRTEQDI